MKSQISNLKSQILRPKLLLLGILVFAAFLRLYRIQDYMTFLGDEGRDVLVVYNILHGKLTLLGPTASVGGFFLGPIYYYFMAPFLLIFNYNPVGPAVMVALFGIATVWLVYKFAKEIFNQRVALISSLLYAISPLVIAHSRSSWNPNIFPFFSLLTLYVIYRALIKNNVKLFILGGVLLGISMQLHYLALFLGFIIAIYVLSTFVIRYLFESSRNILILIKNYLAIFLGFIIGLSPFLAFEVRHEFPNVISIFNFILHSGDTGVGIRFFDNISNVFFRLFGRLITNFPPPEQVAIRAHLDMAVWYYLTLLLTIVCVSVLLYKFVQAFPSLRQKTKESPEFLRLLLLVIWLVVGIGLFGFYKKPIYDYYLGFMFPLPFILTGVAFDFFIFNKKNIFKIAGVAGLIAVVYINLTGVPFRHEPNRQLAQVKKISKFVLEKADDKPFNFALITGGNSDHAYRYFFTLETKSPMIIQNSQVDPERKSVTDQLLVVCEQNPCHPLGNSLWEVAGFGRAEIAGEWPVSVVKVYKLVHYK
ncbi:MAG: hypothetical protein A3B44_02895 [Candidatus Levybacteria bacterium RIFCSPLOWO2_01_FULL_38_21]|nr:MAG: hypothetical protein A3B44_02895 [Candidatus Levybacteria bacterium RIFCSPLOWO2_01_FULL_38_21]